eukprot:jgi/Botrbrau1/23441/Bobra.106_1s0002.1
MFGKTVSKLLSSFKICKSITSSGSIKDPRRGNGGLFRRRVCHVIKAWGHRTNQDSATNFVVTQNLPSQTPLTGQQWNLVTGAAAVLTFTFLLATRGWRQEQREKKRSMLADTQDPLQSEEYQLALARTRQAVATHKAVDFMQVGSQARAMVELEKALEENDRCRAPLLVTRYRENEMVGLYRLYLQMTELPPEFSKLLQLREMLGIEEAVAQGLETSIIGSRTRFSI